jgi:hypothetical protein
VTEGGKTLRSAFEIKANVPLRMGALSVFQVSDFVEQVAVLEGPGGGQVRLEKKAGATARGSRASVPPEREGAYLPTLIVCQASLYSSRSGPRSSFSSQDASSSAVYQASPFLRALAGTLAVAGNPKASQNSA